MNISLTNPCLECDHHLAGGDKNCDRCKNCEKRITYVNAIDKSLSSSVAENVDLDGHGGSHPGTKKLEHLPGSKKIQDVADYETVEKISPSLLEDPIEKHIRSVCQTHGITVKKLRAGTKGRKDPEFHNVRDSIIRVLASGKFGKLRQTKIGKYLGISNRGVSKRMGKMGISPMYSTRGPSNWKKFVKKKAPQPVPATRPEAKETPVQMVIDFTGHIEIHDSLMKTAADQLRTPEMQALYVLKKFHFWGQIPRDTNTSIPGESENWTGRE